MSIPAVTFDCEFLTPTFLAGAHQNGSPELRGPSIRGALRYWYRALLGARGITDPEAVRTEGSKVFGSTDHASPIRLRLLPYGLSDNDTKSNGGIENIDDQNSGTGYLWYFVQAGDNDRSYIAPGARFELQLLARPGQKQALVGAIEALWLLVHLGGLGLRSRRMAGAFDADLIEKPEDLELPSFEVQEEYDDWLADQLEAIGLPEKETPHQPSFSTLAAGHAEVWRLGIPNGSWEELVETVGGRFKEHRGDMGVPDKVGLGLPMETPESEPDIQVSQAGSEVDRRASPLWLQVVRGPDGRLDGIVTFLRSRFAGGGNRVTVLWEGRRKTVNDPYHKLGTFVRDDEFRHISLHPSQQ